MNKYWLRMRELFFKRNKIVYFIVIVIIVILLWPFTCVDLGYKMVSYNSISGTLKVKDSGVQFTVPFIEEKILYPTIEQVFTLGRDADNWAKGIDGSIQVQTKDSQTISIDVSVMYHLDEEKLTEIYSYFNSAGISDIEENHIGLFLRNIMSNIASRYTVDEIYSQERPNFETEVLQQLQQQMESYHIVISNVLISSVRISDIYQELLNAKISSEKELIEANSVGEINKLLNETLTDNVLQYKSIQELNDNVKIIVVPSDTDNQLDLGELYTDPLEEE